MRAFLRRARHGQLSQREGVAFVGAVVGLCLLLVLWKSVLTTVALLAVPFCVWWMLDRKQQARTTQTLERLLSPPATDRSLTSAAVSNPVQPGPGTSALSAIRVTGVPGSAAEQGRKITREVLGPARSRPGREPHQPRDRTRRQPSPDHEAAPANRVDRLSQLAELHRTGLLTKQEFERAKRRLLES